MRLLGTITFNDTVWFCASGKAFFLGILILVTGQLLALRFKIKAGAVGSILIAIIGGILIWLSSTPIWDCWGWLWVSMFGAFYIAPYVLKNISATKLLRIRFLTIILLLLPVLRESQYWISPIFSLGKINRVYVIGDSVSSGIGGPNEATWPKILFDRLKIPVTNLAIAGATAESSLKKQAIYVNELPCMVFVEIGGNDILSATDPAVFEKSMRQMFNGLKTVTNQIAWFELPLLPWKTQYGEIQRKLAEEMKITLIPKRILSDVFQSPGTTSDSIHLTAKGHQMMAEKVSRLFELKM